MLAHTMALPLSQSPELGGENSGLGGRVYVIGRRNSPVEIGLMGVLLWYLIRRRIE